MGWQGARAALLAFSAFAWVAVAAGSTRAQDMERGRELFGLCAQCHGTNGAGVPIAHAPAIAGLGSWYVVGQLNKFRDGQRGSHFDDINGLRMRPMARWLTGEDDVQDVAAYVAALPPVAFEQTLGGGDAARGAALYATCAGCHGPKAEGVEAVGGPPLAHSTDWYLVESLKNFKQGIRGYDPNDSTGAAMRGMANLLADDQAILDVVAHIGTLGAPTSEGE